MKKVLSVACALCMTTAMLTGCGSSNNAGTAATGEAQNSAAASTTTEQASTATVRQHPPPQSRLQLQQTQEPL